MVSQIFLATDSNLKLLYIEENKLWGTIVRNILYLYAPYNFSHGFVFLSTESDKQD